MQTTPPHDLVSEFVQACAGQVRGEVRADLITRALYATDASNYQIEPLAVITPRDGDDVIAAMTLAARFQLPVLPRGGGSSLAGQAVGAAVVLDLSKHMRKLIAVDADARRVRVQPGMSLQALNNQLAAHGLKFGPDPASAVVCTVGGMIGNNSTGSHSILYRMTADNLHAVDVVLSDGTPTRFAPTPRAAIAEHVVRGGLLGAIWQQVPAIAARARADLDARRPNTWRRCGGYNLDRMLDANPLNLAELICGSEGTLATLTEAELKLVPLPLYTAIVLVAFDDLNASLEAVPLILQSDPSAVEQIDRFLMRMQRDAGGDFSITRFIGTDDPESVLVTEFYGDSPAEVNAKIAHLEHDLARHMAGCRIYRFLDQEAQHAIWQMRKAQAGLLARQRGDIKPLNFIEDVAVPVEHLAAYIRDIVRVCNDLRVEVTMSAHASAGCLHVLPFVNLKRADDIENMRRIGSAAADLVLHYRGAMSSEHGDGLARSWLNRHVFGDGIYGAFQQIKAAFDPDNRMNPGKVVGGPPIGANLRYGADYRTISLTTQFDWSKDGGFTGAVEVCNGQGYCRKVTSGTMCPSYMVTLDERDSTRGRANALRNALSGRIPHEKLASRETLDVLDLCVGCKACQSECPSSVDMTRMRSEVLHLYHQEHGLDLRTRAFGMMPLLSRLITSNGGLARLSNAMLAIPPVAALVRRVLRIAPKRHLPRFAPKRFTQIRRAETLPYASGNGRALLNEHASPDMSVVLYVDTWSEHHYPAIAQAAYDVLSAAGYQVIVPGYVCCGRTFLSKGMLTEAKLAAERVFAQLGEHIARGTPIIGLEPSCILSFRDEYLDLTKHPQRAGLSQLAVTFEEFVAANADRFARVLDDQPSGKALLHGHCHQKALTNMSSVHTALALGGYDVREADSGCCGMAGSFGYEAEHDTISCAMAERALLPAVRAAADAVVIAAGVSCRQQIGDLAGRQAIHPAEALAQHLRHELAERLTVEVE
jgi:FAD/FMN-containing dehydrogenase/Fe-S oxidoreductase